MAKGPGKIPTATLPPSNGGKGIILKTQSNKLINTALSKLIVTQLRTSPSNKTVA